MKKIILGLFLLFLKDFNITEGFCPIEHETDNSFWMESKFDEIQHNSITELHLIGGYNSYINPADLASKPIKKYEY